ncbi:MAG: hypothetical protein ACTTH4_06675 [Prevotella denticola]|uniref:hypothetical protein n=1 Tax=Prevotella denticola TaxID=28129 RepID=UPI003F9F3901
MAATATDRASRQMCRGPAPVVPTADTRRADGPNPATYCLRRKQHTAGTEAGGGGEGYGRAVHDHKTSHALSLEP